MPKRSRPLALLLALAASLTFVAVAPAEVKEFGTRVSISRGVPLYHGQVHSEKGGCTKGRTVKVKRVRKGRDATVGKDVSDRNGRWQVNVSPKQGQRFYAKAKRSEQIVGGKGYLCKADRSRTQQFVGG